MLLSPFIITKLSVGLMILGAGVVCGQDYPIKPVRIVTVPAGGGSDFDARQIAQGISGPLGQPVIVDNRGSGVIAAEAVSKAPPDGYSLLLNGASTWVGPLSQKVPYDILNDFSPIALIERSVNVVAIHPSVPAKSIKELIALAKARPGELNYSSSSTGGVAHLGVELFKSLTGVSILRINYKGNATNPPDIAENENLRLRKIISSILSVWLAIVCAA